MNYVSAFFKALFSAPFLLFGNLFVGIADAILGKQNSEYVDDRMGRKLAEKLVLYLWLILILGIIAVGITE